MSSTPNVVVRIAQKDPLEPEICEHKDDYGSTIIFVDGRPKDGICMLCNEYFTADIREGFKGILKRPPIVKRIK